jgi:hypothetical protein
LVASSSSCVFRTTTAAPKLVSAPASAVRSQRHSLRFSLIGVGDAAGASRTDRPVRRRRRPGMTVAWHTEPHMSEPARHVVVSGDLNGEYIVDEQLPDGSIVIRPDTSAAAMRRRLGLKHLGAAEFDALMAEHADELLPPDDEG